MIRHRLALVFFLLTLAGLPPTRHGLAAPFQLESPRLKVTVDSQTGRWSLVDKGAGTRWPSMGEAAAGEGKGLDGSLKGAAEKGTVSLALANGGRVSFRLVREGESLEIRYEGLGTDEIRTLGDALAITEADAGAVVVPCREGLLIPAGKTAFRHTFGTSDYEGCHMNMLGLVKRGSALVVDWDDAYTFPELVADGKGQIRTSIGLRRTARLVRLTPLGKGDHNSLAAGYRRIAEGKKLAATMDAKIRRNAHAERMLGAANVKLWTCLARRMNEESTKEESAKVRWTFDEAAQIAEHLKRDLKIDRCLFILGGWTEGGYDCRHPDNLPANPECGGNAALAQAVRRVQALGYVASLHDNYQDMYRDAKSWSPDFIEKRPDGSMIQGGRWLGGRAYMVCAPKQVELAMRPQNMPEIQRLFAPWSYFIDTTYAVGPRECSDPKHKIDRNQDIAFKRELSEKSREIFGLFGSECGREWALPVSDFFEGLTGVSGKYFHNLKPESLGARVIPFWEMVYHDCQVCYGKYGYSAEQAAEYVAHHLLCARPLHYHSIPDHLYWKEPRESRPSVKPAATAGRSCFTRTDQGWAAEMHPIDAFLKNTHEVLGPLNLATAHQRLTRLEFLSADGSLRRAQYGEGDAATRVVVNFGSQEAAVDSAFGGQVKLPPWGFAIDGPRMAAFYATRWAGRDYPAGAMFAIRSAVDLKQAAKIRVFHAFGDPAIAWKGRTHQVPREAEFEVPR